MMLQIPGALTKAQAADCRRLVDAAEWVDGNVTSGFQAALAKSNLQLAEGSEAAQAAGRVVTEALRSNLLFLSAALPQTILPPLFNRYRTGDGFKAHIDNSIRRNPETGASLRADLSATLFLSEPGDYDGGELMVEDTYGVHEVKLEAGDLILYPSSSLHSVAPITRGERIASFLWVQSLVRGDAQRALLFDMDMAVQRLGGMAGQDDPSVVALTGVYHNLLRLWAEP